MKENVNSQGVAILDGKQISFTPFQVSILRFLQENEKPVTPRDIFIHLYEGEKDPPTMSTIGRFIYLIVERISEAELDPDNFLLIHKKGNNQNSKIIGIEIPKGAPIILPKNTV